MGFACRQEERIELYDNIYQEVLRTSRNETQQLALQNEAKEVCAKLTSLLIFNNFFYPFPAL